MAVQYWVGDFLVDLSRNQITQNEHSQTIAPKALAVLTCLAENQGKVVSHASLLAEVWQDTAVTPNTLQRSIAQLRKALGDDGKVQLYIKTHAKQGYSLECDVRWLDGNDLARSNSSQDHTVDQNQVIKTSRNTTANNTPKALTFVSRMNFIIAGVIMTSFIGYQYLTPKSPPNLAFDTLRSLTATDDKEFDATYSPDGQYIVFHRYFDKQCINKLWAKNIITQKEIPLTTDWGNYGSHSFSEDGKTLVFLATEACNDQASPMGCYNLVSLDFEKALKSPQQPSLVLQCKNSELKKPIWLSSNNIALLQKHSIRWKLINYSINENASTVLYDQNEGNLIDFSYSAREDLIAVISIHSDGHQYIKMFKPDGQVFSSHQIELPPEIPKVRLIYPNFDPLNKQLIFSTGRQLFTLSYEGKVAKISIPFADKMVRPEFHPDGKSLLLIKGPYDSDIVRLPLHQIAETNPLTQTGQAQMKPPLTYPSFERSNLGEDHASFQPGGELIAFWSDRSGEQQVWITDGNGPLQLTQFPMDTSIGGFDWANDGNSLLVNANGVLTQVFLDARQKTFLFEHPVVRLFQWESENNSALLIARIKGLLKCAEYDLNTFEIREITDKGILWALKSEDGRLIYKDYKNQFWQPGPAEAELIKPLENQGGKSKSFVMKGNVIYAVNREHQLWSYDLNHDRFTIIGEVAKDVDYLTDMNQTQLLMTIQVSAKKEVVELSISQ